jgi:glycosyltransferase involved in cell wall biosynthesis
MHENYPAALRFFDQKGIINLIFKNPELSAVLEKFCLKWSDRIIVVVDEGKNRLLKSGVENNKISVVSNTVDIQQWQSMDENITADQNEFSALSGKKILLYTGRVSIERGLDTAILAMNILKKRIPDIFLLIVGDGGYVKTLLNLVQQSELSDLVRLLKWPGQEHLSFFFKIASICIIPQPRNDFINTTIPHKLFEYMLQEKAVLTSDAIPFERILEETNCGMSFKSNDPESFAEVAEQILSSQIPFGKNGVKAVYAKYNWENDSKTLIKLYDEFKSKESI